MQPLDIQYQLRRRGYTQADIARIADVTSAMVSRVVHGKDRCLAVEVEIEKVIGVCPWPEAHHRRPRKNGRAD